MAKWGRDKWGHQNAQFLTQFLQWWAFCLHSLSVDRGTFATLVGDCTPDVSDVRRCHPLVLPRRRGVLPLLNLVEVGERLHIYSVSCLRRCVLQSKTLNDCIAISQLHRNFAIFQKLQRNFRILHVKLHFFVSPFVPSPFGPPQP